MRCAVMMRLIMCRRGDLADRPYKGRPYIWIILLVFLAGCGSIAPAKLPAQLDNTPGPSVVLSDNVYQSTAFNVRYPDGWQVVTSPADRPVWVVFTDDTAVIVIATRAEDTQITLADAQREERTVNGLTAALIAPPEDYPAYLAMFDAVLDTVVTF